MKLLLAASVAILTSTSVQAAPWRVDTLTLTSGVLHSTVQFSDDGDYALVIECMAGGGDFTIYVESPFDWEDGASYAPEVPATLIVDGAAISNVMFHFDERQLAEGIAAVPQGQAEAFEAMLARLHDASGPIELRYFDRAATFSAEDLGEALQTIRRACV